MTSDQRQTVARAGLALAIGALSGIVAASLGLPLPWMLGPMIGVTISALAAAPIQGPERLRPLVIPVIGVMLGSGMSPEVFDLVARWIWTMALLPVFVLCAAAVSYQFYRRVGRYDRVTAYFSAMPGGLNDMLIVGGAAGGDEKRIALAHASRILVVITFVVLFFGFVFGVRSGGVGGRWVDLATPAALDWLVLIACAVLGDRAGRLIRLPAAPILGPMILSAAAHIAELVTIAPPSLLVIGAQIVVGTVIGCRFLGAALRDVGRDLGLGAVSSVLMIAVAVIFAEIVSGLTGIGPSQAFLAYSPGGLTEMGLLAFAMGQDVAYVTVTHLIRILVVVFGALPVFRMMPGSRS